MSFFIKKVISSSLKKGQRQRAENLLFDSLRLVKNNLIYLKGYPLKYILKVVELNVIPLIELYENNNRRNKKRYPFCVKFRRSKKFAAKYVAKGINSQLADKVIDRVFYEFLSIFNNKGFAVKTKESLYDFAIENQAFIWKTGKKRRKRRKKIKRY